MNIAKEIRNYINRDVVLKKNILDPYFLGLWLGCGCLSKPEIATIEKDIVDFLKVFTEDLNLKLYEYKKKDEIPRYNIQDSSDEKNSNNIFNVMKELNLFSNSILLLVNSSFICLQ